MFFKYIFVIENLVNDYFYFINCIVFFIMKYEIIYVKWFWDKLVSIE